MADAYLGGEALFKIGAAANTLTTISGQGMGLSSVSIPQEVATRDIPGGTTVQRQSLKRKDSSISFEVDANSVTWPLLYNKAGETLFFEYGPRGSANGMPKRTGSAILTSIGDDVDSEDVIRFTVEGVVNGAVTEGTYS